MTTYRELLERQAELQRISRSLGQRAYTDTELRLAYLDEVGELIHECKPIWCWWKTYEEGVVWGRAISEMADVLHFALIGHLDLYGPPMEDEDWYDEPVTCDPSGHQAFPMRESLAALVQSGGGSPDLKSTLALLGYLAYALDGGMQDVVDAYFEKTEINIRRWEAAQHA